MEEFPNQRPSDDQDLPFRITAPFGLEDSEYDQIIDLDSAAYPLVNSSGTNLYPDFPVEQQFKAQSPSISGKSMLLRHLEFLDQLELQLELQLQRQLQLQLQCLSVDEACNQELCCLFNMFHNHKINAKKLGTALKSLEEKYYYPGTDHRRFIRCGDVAGTSPSRLEGAGSSGYPSTSGYPSGANACGGGVPVGIGLVNNSGDPSSSVKHSPPGKGKAPHEEGAGNPSTSGYPPGTHACGGGVPVGSGLVNNNGDPSSTVKHSPPGKGKAPYEEGAGNPSTSGYPLGTHACGGGVPVGIGLANNNGDPSSSVKHSPPGKGKAPYEEGAGNPSTSGYSPGTHASGGGVPVGIGLVNNNGDPSSSVKHSPPGKGKVPHEEGAGGFADVSRDAIGSMNASYEGDLEMGLVNNNADPSAPRDVHSSVVHHVDHTAAGSGVYGENVAMAIFQVATAAYRTATSKFAQGSHTTSLAMSMAAILLADTNWKAAMPILSKAGIVVCGVGVLADIGKDLPLPLFMGATSAALLIIIVAILFAKRPA